MKWTVRQKLYVCMGLIVLIIGGVHAITKQAYMESRFDEFRRHEVGEAYLSAPPGEQIEIMKTYVSGKMKQYALGNLVFFIATGLLVSLWISGMLTLPLRKLVAAIERVKQGDLDVNVPVQSKDEYGDVIRTFNEMTLRLREAEDARRRLVADVAHELRTPLSIMQLKLENAQQTGPYVSPEMLLRLQDEAIRLGHLVEDLHVLSLAEAGRLALDCKPLDLSAKLEQIVDDMKMDAEDNGLEMSFRSNKGTVTMMADARRITQVFINLLTNAIRYTPEGGTISVELEAAVRERGATYTRVSVTDTGIGIPAEELAHLFDRFYRVEKARSRHTGGTGLGLSIAHHFVRAHGGFIRVASEPDRGTTFAVYLPSGE